MWGQRYRHLQQQLVGPVQFVLSDQAVEQFEHLQYRGKVNFIYTDGHPPGRGWWYAPSSRHV